MSEPALLQPIRDAPDDDAPRLVYADWLDEQGRGDEAELVRLQCAYASQPPDDVDWTLVARAQRLLSSVIARWDVPPYVVPTVGRGLPERVVVVDPALLGNAAALAPAATTLRAMGPLTSLDGWEPLRAIDIWDQQHDLARLLAPLPRLRTLACSLAPVTPALVRCLARLEHLRALDLAWSGPDDLAAVADAAPAVEQLTLLRPLPTPAPAALARFARLRALSIADHPRYADALPALALERLRLWVRLDADAFDATDLALARRCTTLTALALEGRVRDRDVASLASLPDLRQLTLGDVDGDLWSAARALSLRKLTVSDTSPAAACRLADLERLPGSLALLRALDLRATTHAEHLPLLDVDAARALRVAAPGLQRLTLHGTLFPDALRALGQHPALRVLELARPQRLTDDDYAHLAAQRPDIALVLGRATRGAIVLPGEPRDHWDAW